MKAIVTKHPIMLVCLLYYMATVLQYLDDDQEEDQAIWPVHGPLDPIDQSRPIIVVIPSMRRINIYIINYMRLYNLGYIPSRRYCGEYSR